MLDFDVEELFERLEELAQAQCDVDQIASVLRVEFLLPFDKVQGLLEQPEMEQWIADNALKGQADLQQRMWQVARDLPDTPEGVKMSQWLARNFLGHSGTDVSTEVKALLAKVKADPTGQTDLLDKALELVGGR